MNRFEAHRWIASVLRASVEPGEDGAGRQGPGAGRDSEVSTVVDEERIAQVALSGKVSTNLAACLPKVPRAASQVEKEFRHFLAANLLANRVRNAALLRQLGGVARSLNERGIEPMVLKGMGHLVTGLYGDAGERISADLDLLVPEDEAGLAYGALRKLGYRPVEIVPESGQHLPALLHPEEITSVELHRWAFPRDYGFRGPLLTWSRDGATRHEIHGGRLWVASPEIRFQRLLIHDRLYDERQIYGILQLRSLWDGFLLLRQVKDLPAYLASSRALFEEKGQELAFDSFLAALIHVFSWPLPLRGQALHPAAMSSLARWCSQENWELRRKVEAWLGVARHSRHRHGTLGFFARCVGGVLDPRETLRILSWLLPHILGRSGRGAEPARNMGRSSLRTS